MDRMSTIAMGLRTNVSNTFGVSSYSKLEKLSEHERRVLVERAKKRHSRKAPKVHTIVSGNPYLMLGLKVNKRYK